MQAIDGGGEYLQNTTIEDMIVRMTLPDDPVTIDAHLACHLLDVLSLYRPWQIPLHHRFTAHHVHEDVLKDTGLPCEAGYLGVLVTLNALKDRLYAHSRI